MPDKKNTKETAQTSVTESIRKEIAKERLPEDERLGNLFEAELTYINTIDSDERLRLINAISRDGTVKVSARRWADWSSRQKLLEQLEQEVTESEIQQRVNETQKAEQDKVRQKSYRPYIGIAQKYKDEKPTDTKLERMARAETALQSICQPGTSVTNPSLIREYVYNAINSDEPITFAFIRCPRFIFPNGNPEIARGIERVEYFDKQGNSISRDNSPVIRWTRRSINMANQFSQLLPTRSMIVVADTDITDVRPLGVISEKNLAIFTKDYRELFPNASIQAASDIEKNDPSLSAKYRDLYFRSAAYLLNTCCGICNQNEAPPFVRSRIRLKKYGFNDEVVSIIFSVIDSNDKQSFSLPITQQTFEQTCEEERASQLRTLSEVGARENFFEYIKFYAAFMIARDIAQFAVLLPSIGKQVIYVCDRKPKAASFGFVGCAVAKVPTLPTIFANYQANELNIEFDE